MLKLSIIFFGKPFRLLLLPLIYSLYLSLFLSLSHSPFLSLSLSLLHCLPKFSFHSLAINLSVEWIGTVGMWSLKQTKIDR